jgi:hypothetical protein
MEMDGDAARSDLRKVEDVGYIEGRIAGKILTANYWNWTLDLLPRKRETRTLKEGGMISEYLFHVCCDFVWLR